MTTAGIRELFGLEEEHAIGVLPSQWIQTAFEQRWIQAEEPFQEGQLQPNSLDLRLGRRAYRVQSSFLPGSEGIESKLKRYSWYDFDLVDSGTILERNQVYIIPLSESLNLPEQVYGYANPKSSTGRLDVFARLVVSNGTYFDRVPPGYSGPLYLEVVPRSFPITLRPGDALAQMRFQIGDPHYSDEQTEQLINAQTILLNEHLEPLSSEAFKIRSGVYLSARLSGEPGEIVGYRARKNTPPIDLRTKVPAEMYWEPVKSRPHTPVILDPDEFYIFASRELFCLPPQVCAEMIPFDASSGEVRTHYAGFFDSGFGFSPNRKPSESAAAAVLEIRSRDVPFMIEDGHPLFRLRFLKNIEIPDVLYGQGLSSNYQKQRLKLAKQFVMSSS